MEKIFINYRRSDTYDTSCRLANALRSEFGEKNVFFDQTSAIPGMAWPDSIRDTIEKSDALIIVIGPKWLHTHDEKSGRRRIDVEDDWVRLEIITFLKRKKANDNLLILPLLVSGATMPQSEYLEVELKPLGGYADAKGGTIRRPRWWRTPSSSHFPQLQNLNGEEADPYSPFTFDRSEATRHLMRYNSLHAEPES